jgi:hypothetical protein
MLIKMQQKDAKGTHQRHIQRGKVCSRFVCYEDQSHI